jgi:hypothetical protein
MTFKNSVGTTRAMTKEEMSGHMNEDYSFPSVVATVTTAGDVNRGINDPSTARGVKAPVVITDISADQHGSWVNGVETPNEVHGFPFKVREV